jgi:NAD(P)-dependent dehydrogenase (short-subunit alcohol dehydrogenase family)
LGIRVNVLCPGLVITPNVIANNTPEEIARIEAHSLTPYLGRPEDMAAVVAFLASDDARYVNGHVLTADGGYTSHMPHTGEIADSFARDSSRRVGAVD